MIVESVMGIEEGEAVSVLDGLHSTGSSPRAVDVTSHCLAFIDGYNDLEIKAIDDIRIVTYNIHGWRDTDHEDNFERIVALLSELDADVVALQEVLHPYRPPSNEAERGSYFSCVKSGKGNGFENSDQDSQMSYLETLSNALGMKYISFGCATSDGYFGKFGYGNAVLSRLPIVRECHLVIRPDERHQAGRRIEAEDRCFSAVSLAPSPLSAINTHEIESQEEWLTVCVTHLDQLSDELRHEQIQAVLEAAAPFGRHILCGDLNVFQRRDTPEERWDGILADAACKGWPAPPEESAALEELLASGYQDCFFLSDNHRRGQFHKRLWREGMSRDIDFPSATCWVTKPLLRIDYAFLSPGRSRLVPEPAVSDRSSDPSDSDVSDTDSAAGGCFCHAENCWAEVLQYQRVSNDASDHFPVVIDLAVPRVGRSFKTSWVDSDEC